MQCLLFLGHSVTILLQMPMVIKVSYNASVISTSSRKGCARFLGTLWALCARPAHVLLPLPRIRRFAHGAKLDPYWGAASSSVLPKFIRKLKNITSKEGRIKNK